MKHHSNKEISCLIPCVVMALNYIYFPGEQEKSSSAHRQDSTHLLMYILHPSCLLWIPVGGIGFSFFFLILASLLSDSGYGTRGKGAGHGSGGFEFCL